MIVMRFVLLWLGIAFVAGYCVEKPRLPEAHGTFSGTYR